MADVRADADTLLTGLKEELEAYRAVEAISSDELRLVKEAELEKATAVLAKKQELLGTIAAVEERIRPLKAKWPAMKDQVPAELKMSFQSTLGDLSSLLERLIALERETEEVLSGQIAVVRKAAPSVSPDNVRKAYGVKPEGKK
jgi:hypothetical protein